LRRSTLKRILLILPIFLLTTSCFWQSAGAKPGVVAFTATPATIEAGQSTTLMWNVTNSTSVQIDPGAGSGLAAAGTISLSPLTTTTYKLTAGNSSGNSEAYVTVSVSSISGTTLPPPANIPGGSQIQAGQRPNIVVFDISPNAINVPPGSGAHSATMRWEVKNAANVTLNGSPVPPIGNQVLTPPVGTHTYLLRAFNPAGEDSRTQTLHVNP
jgi:hypothetical protein